MGRTFPRWAPRQIRGHGWHIREGGSFLPLRPIAGAQPITVDDVEEMIRAGLLIRLSLGDRDAVAWREQSRDRKGARHGSR